ncbi:uncharacterized protein LOC117168332 [Belonocnema kinseyi]|uniref:uncharacterized protein LOC117168332 n=1 Tax=Belonocnema kinseyi TaxID=2817044 RepID=UPI00143D4E64|nr:uncharacterized protein LOC117168332 [Belonocnema kinseyi]XP_033209801.1 uncharacterized protein LOC117168332 [Belonocnema kinseyi]
MKMNLMSLLKSFFRRITKDFRQKELLPIKIAFFVKASTLFVLYPYLTIHMRELGINVQETALMSAVTPLAVIIMPPLAGIVADRIGNFRVSLAFLTSLGGLAALLLLTVPVGRVNLEYPDRVILDVSCPGSNENLIYEMSPKYPCEPNLKSEVNMRIESCGLLCYAPMDTDVESLLEERAYTIEITEKESVIVFNYTTPETKLKKVIDETEDVRSHRKLKNDAFFKTSIREITNNTFYFPTDDLYQFKCNQIIDESKEGKNVTKILKCGFDQIYDREKSRNSQVIDYRPFKTTLKALESTDDLLMEVKKYLVQKSNWTGQNLINVQCDNPERADRNILISAGNYNVMNCTQRCLLTAPRAEMCSNMKEQVVYNIQLTFWLYLAIRVFIGTAWGYIESFLFWFLQDLGASQSLMGVTITVSGLAGLPLLVLSGPIIAKLGHANVLFIGFIFYAIRLVGYSLIYNPWLCLIFEALESVTSGLAFTAAVTYAAKLSTTATDSSVQGLLGGIYYGVGKSCGSLIGGFLMKAVGTRSTYQIFAAASLLTGLMYCMFNVFYLKKRPQVEGNDIVKKEPKKTKSDLENGSVEIGLKEKKQKQNQDKEKIASGYDNKAYSYSAEDQMKIESAKSTSKDIEALNNVKNLDKIEKISEPEEKKIQDKTGYSKNEENAITNPPDVFEDKIQDDKHNVTIEKEPEEKK